MFDFVLEMERVSRPNDNVEGERFYGLLIKGFKVVFMDFFFSLFFSKFV